MTTIDKAKDFFEYAVNSSQYTSWKAKAKESYQMYDGQQWTAAEITTLEDRKQPAIVVNKLAQLLHSVHVQQAMIQTD